MLWQTLRNGVSLQVDCLRYASRTPGVVITPTLVGTAAVVCLALALYTYGYVLYAARVLGGGAGALVEVAAALGILVGPPMFALVSIGVADGALSAYVHADATGEASVRRAIRCGLAHPIRSSALIVLRSATAPLILLDWLYVSSYSIPLLRHSMLPVGRVCGGRYRRPLVFATVHVTQNDAPLFEALSRSRADAKEALGEFSRGPVFGLSILPVLWLAAVFVSYFGTAFTAIAPTAAGRILTWGFVSLLPVVAVTSAAGTIVASTLFAVHADGGDSPKPFAGRSLSEFRGPLPEAIDRSR